MRFFNTMQNPVGDSTFQTVQNALLDIMGELEAIVQYQNHLRQTDKLSAQRTIADIISEEQIHVGQLMGLVFNLDPAFKTQFDKGIAEYQNTLAVN